MITTTIRELMLNIALIATSNFLLEYDYKTKSSMEANLKQFNYLSTCQVESEKW